MADALGKIGKKSIPKLLAGVEFGNPIHDVSITALGHIGAEAAPNLVRSSGGATGPLDRREAARLEILRALERGDLDIEDASHKLEILEDAGPRYFRGWC